MIKQCKICGKELPLERFRRVRNGKYVDTCYDCQTANRRANKQIGGGNIQPISDPDFDGLAPVDVIQTMSRAKRWLESRGYEIILKGSYTMKKEVKF